MNPQYMEQARAAYRAGEFSVASSMFLAAKEPGEVCGEADHLRGNCLMRLGLYADAASAYADALADTAYGKQGAILTNRGKALSASGDFDGAVQAFSAATRDASYATPYKAYLGLGNALLSLGNVTDAGVAFRSAAIDGTNPAPAGALASLGSCFLQLGRPADAVEAYRTALDYAGPHDDERAFNAGLGEALAANGKVSDAVDAFQAATNDGLYQLTADQQAAFSQAQDALSAQRSIAHSATAAMDVDDPLDPLGKSGAFMPDPSDTGFFTLSESEMIQQDRQDKKIRRKKRHTGRKVFIVILILLLLAAGGLGFAYTRGLGFPSQESAITGLFQAVTDNSDASQYLSSSLSEDAKAAITSSIPTGATPSITSMDQNMTTSTAEVSVQLSQGGTVTYKVEFDRSSNRIGWTVRSITADYGTAGTGASATGQSSTSTDSTADAADASVTSDATGESTDDTDAAVSTDDSASDASADSASETDQAATDGASTDSAQ